MDRQPNSPTRTVKRAFDLLEALAQVGGSASITVLAGRTGLANGSTHRLLRTLVDLGLVRQLPSKEYALGPGLVRLGLAASSLTDQWAMPHLIRVVDELGETANLAVRDNDTIIYIAQAPSKHTMRMFTEVGRRVLPHCTGVGKVLLAHLEKDEISAILGRVGMPYQTHNTITTRERFFSEVEKIQKLGYALDDGEQELGVRCIAVSLPGASSRLAVSVSGPEGRFQNSRIRPAARLLSEVASDLSRDLQVHSLW